MCGFRSVFLFRPLFLVSVAWRKWNVLAVPELVVLPELFVLSHRSYFPMSDRFRTRWMRLFKRSQPYGPLSHCLRNPGSMNQFLILQYLLMATLFAARTGIAMAVVSSRTFAKVSDFGCSLQMMFQAWASVSRRFCQFCSLTLPSLLLDCIIPSGMMLREIWNVSLVYLIW